jgi:hypothetical protein
MPRLRELPCVNSGAALELKASRPLLRSNRITAARRCRLWSWHALGDLGFGTWSLEDLAVVTRYSTMRNGCVE